MKRTGIIIIGILIIIFAVFFLREIDTEQTEEPLVTEDTTEITDVLYLNVATSYEDDNPTNKGLLIFATEVERLSKGSIQIKISSNGKYGTEEEILQQLQFGGVDFAVLNTKTVSAVVPDMEILTSPFIYKSEEHRYAVLDGYIGQNLLENLPENNLIGLTYYDSMVRGIASNESFNEIEYLADKVIGSSFNQNQWNYLEELDSTIYNHNLHNLYLLLDNDTVDCAEVNLYEYYKYGLFETSEYFMLEEYYYIPDVFLASEITMNSLTEKQQEIITEAALDSYRVEKGYTKAHQETIIANLIKNNVTFNSFSFGELGKIYEAIDYESEDTEEIMDLYLDSLQ